MNIMKYIFLATVFFVSTLCFNTTQASNNQPYKAKTHGKVVIANRASGSLSIIDASTNNVIKTIQLPNSPNQAEPMYVVYKNGKIFVGDRANNQVVVLDSSNYQVLTNIPAGAGVFHMWADQYRGNLWVNNDIDNSVTIIDTYSLKAIHTYDIPEDLTAMGFKPHDIFVTPNGRFAYISLIDGMPGNDYLLKIRARDYKEVARQEIGGDPHLFISSYYRSDLFVPSQDDGMLNLLNSRDLSIKKQIPLSGAHGIFSIGRRLYVTNISANGVDALNTFDAKRLRKIDSDDTLSPVPHNITVSSDGRKIYITHSGATQNKVSVFDTQPGYSTPIFNQEITVENNPFGLAFIPY